MTILHGAPNCLLLEVAYGVLWRYTAICVCPKHSSPFTMFSPWQLIVKVQQLNKKGPTPDYPIGGQRESVVSPRCGRVLGAPYWKIK